MAKQSYQLKTRRGYDFFECSSTFQKAVRRGDEKVALFFAVELYLSGYDAYLWKRMRVIVSEDVGLAYPMTPAIIESLYRTYMDLKPKKADSKKHPEKLMLIHAVLFLCRVKKSRLVDWTVIAEFSSHEEERMAIPDYAYDMHNITGRKMGRGLDHFFGEGTSLFNHVVMEGEEEAKQRAYKAKKKAGSSVLFPLEDADEVE